MTQSSFEFDPPRPEPAPAGTPVAKVSPSSSLSLEDMAKRLEQNLDYRVLRRLVPIMDFGPHSNAAHPDQAKANVVRVLVLDTETTGLSHQTDKIIELAMLLVDVDTASGLPFGPVELFEGFEDPGMPIPPIAKEVTGITDDMVQGQRLDDQQVEAMVARADLIVAHNAGFDRPFVEARFPGLAQKSWACSFLDIDWKSAGAGSAKLSALTNDQGWFYDAHRAQVDCHALLQVLTRPVAKSGTTGLNHLIVAASKPGFKLRATGSPFESKDKLKSRGYRWDSEGRVWTCTLMSQELLDAECEWLKAEVYGRRGASIEIESQDSAVRYSVRSGLVVEKAL